MLLIFLLLFIDRSGDNKVFSSSFGCIQIAIAQTYIVAKDDLPNRFAFCAFGKYVYHNFIDDFSGTFPIEKIAVLKEMDRELFNCE